MEAFGFGMSVVAVIGAFENCTKLYNDILSLRNRDQDVQASCMLVQIELRTFQKLRDVLEQDSPSATPTNALCNGILQWVQDDLERIHELCSQHSLTSSGPFTIPSLSGAEGNTGNEDSAQGMKTGQNSSNVKKLARRITWIASDKQRLKELVTRLHQWNDGLGTLVPEVKRQRISYETVSASIASNSVRRLENIEQATSQQHPVISQVAEVKKLTLRSRSTLSNPEHASLGKARFSLSLESFEWLAVDLKSITGLQATAPNSMNLSTASARERAFAVYKKKQGESVIKNPDSTGEMSTVIVEWRDDFRSEESLKQFEYRLDYLVTILRKMSGQELGRGMTSANRNFSIFHCLGWVTTSPQFDRIGLVFHLPQRSPRSVLPRGLPITSPVTSLQDWIVQTRREHLDMPALGQRFRLAYNLALTLGNLVSVGWVHKELRSHNILFLTDTGNNSDAIGELYLTGFTYARPSSDNARDLSLLNMDPTYDLYRPSQHVMFMHQQRLLLQQQRMNPESDETANENDSGRDDATPLLRWTSATDIYGLGMILLEIGLWRTVQSLKGSRISKVDFVDRLLDTLVNSLTYRMGVLYTGVVRSCLRLGNWVDDEAEVKKFYADAIETLALCRA